MVLLTAFWLPVLLSAIIVFIASSITHPMLPYHRGDYQRFPDADKLPAKGSNLKRVQASKVCLLGIRCVPGFEILGLFTTERYWGWAELHLEARRKVPGNSRLWA